MKSNEFQKILGNLTKEEFTEFGLYLKSPYFKVPKRFSALYDMIAGQKKSDMRGHQVNDITLSSKEINDKFYPNSLLESNQLNIRKLISDFRKYLDKYKAQSAFDKDMLTQRKMELSWLREKNDLNGYLKHSGETVEYIKNNFDKDEDYYLNLIDIYAKRYGFSDSGMEDPKTTLAIVLNDLLDKYFASMKLFIQQRLVSIEYSTNADLKKYKTFQNSLNEYVNNNAEDLKNEHPEIYLRFIAVKLHANGFEEGLYEEYIRVLNETAKKFRINENGLLLTLLNLISKFINTGAQNLDSKVLEVAELLYDKSIISKKGIGYIDLKIIIESAISFKAYDWAIEYMLKVRQNIGHENSENVFNLLTAKLYFFKGNYPEARKLLSNLTIEDFIFYCEAKLIESRISYNENDIEGVITSTESVLKHITHHEDIGTHFAGAYKSFAKNFRKVAILLLKDLKQNDLIYELKLIEKSLNELDMPCYAQNWLLEQINKKGAG